ncbi:hypothetical protein BDN70DRAFT_997340 [Pholiota conissans]|uniref:Uncharacterized protein n=1 Tax=Pholiota conissans TaxID=109636 RepID=A0A9P6CNY9_9AGAR|nr:hypothetical protein BDN70DRAFT_997340 [Pholiota conissans]
MSHSSENSDRMLSVATCHPTSLGTEDTTSKFGPFDIRTLELSLSAGHRKLYGGKEGDEGEEAMVGEGQATSFITGISHQNKHDVMNSTLLAQLSANAMFNRYSEPEKWYEYYRFVLENLGWVVTGFVFTEQSLQDIAVSVDKIVLDFLQTYLDPTQLSTIERVISALKNKEDPAVKIFRSAASDSHQANFQIGCCEEDENENVSFSIGCFAYSTSDNITNALFANLHKANAKFQNAFQTMTLNTQVYALIREKVIAKLAENAENLIDKLVISRH